MAHLPTLFLEGYMNKNNEVDLDDDFGFSFIDDEIDELSKKQTLDAEKLEQLYSIMIRFLDNLSQSPEKKSLLWPDRVEKIKIFKQKLKDIKEGRS